MLLAVIAGFGLVAWVYLLFGHAGFWRASERLGDGGLDRWPEVVVLVPARDEAATIAACLRSLSTQDYPGRFSVILVDDDSHDGTATIARTVADGAAIAIDIATSPPLPPGWSGKLAALHHGMAEAARLHPAAEYLWLTDADIVHGPGILRQLVAKAKDRDLVSLMVKLNVESFWERLLIPAFVFFFQMLYPFPAINRGWFGLAGAAGGCILINRAALVRSGGFSAIKGALIDDCALAALIRRQGGKLWLGLGDDSFSIRPYRHLGEIWAMVARTAFTQLRHSVSLLLAAVVGMVLVFVVPILLVLTLPFHGGGVAAMLALAAFLLMLVAYRPTLGYYRLAGWRGVLLPVAAALYGAMTVASAIAHWRGRGGAWKRRHYS